LSYIWLTAVSALLILASPIEFPIALAILSE
jgi:hypothetical protein